MDFQSSYLTVGSDQGLKVTLSTLGAGVRALHFLGQPMILELSDEKEYLSADQFFGKTLGRVAGRIPAHPTLGLKTLSLEEDPGEKDIVLHGGLLHSLSFREFHAFLQHEEGSTLVTFEYDSPALENGFPGNLKVRILYRIPDEGDTMKIEFHARSDEDTYVNLSNHMYFNFAGSKNVDEYKLQVRASSYSLFAKGTELPLGKGPVPKALDFREGVRLKDALDLADKTIPVHNFDHFLYFDRIQTEDPQAVLEGNGYRMSLFTDYEGLNGYCDESMQKRSFKNAPDLLYRRALALEPEKANWPLENLLLPAGKEYVHFAAYRFEKLTDPRRD